MSKSQSAINLQRFTPGWIAPRPRSTRTCNCTLFLTFFLKISLNVSPLLFLPLSFAHLLHIADHGGEFEPLALGVDGVQPTHQVLEEEFEDLREAEHRLVPDHEGGDLLPAIVHDLAVVRCWVVRADHRWGRPCVGPALGPEHPVEGEVGAWGGEGGEVLGGREAWGEGRHAWESHGGPGEHGGHGDHGQ